MEEAADEPEERTETEREVEEPESERDRRPDTERREVDERDEERAEAREEERCEELSRLLARPPPAIPVGGEETMPVGETTGARPQVSQVQLTAAHVLVGALARRALALRTHRISPSSPGPERPPVLGAVGPLGPARCRSSAAACW
ncbi:hypothetical protein SMICM304S_05628 [Streptomyces microflavus]